MEHMKDNIIYNYFVQNRDVIEDALDSREDDEKSNALLLSHLIFKAVDIESDILGRTDKCPDEAVQVAAASLSYTDILGITIHLMKHYKDYDNEPVVRKAPPVPGIGPRSECTCECHKPGVNMVHCQPCCY